MKFKRHFDSTRKQLLIHKADDSKSIQCIFHKHFMKQCNLFSIAQVQAFIAWFPIELQMLLKNFNYLNFIADFVNNLNLIFKRRLKESIHFHNKVNGLIQVISRHIALLFCAIVDFFRTMQYLGEWFKLNFLCKIILFYKIWVNSSSNEKST